MPDTPVFSYSIGKGVAATVVHTLAERGVLGYDTRIADLEMYAKRVPRATFRAFDARGHQFDGDLSEVARDIGGLGRGEIQRRRT